jgi:GT2 family glycosyltransferase
MFVDLSVIIVNWKSKDFLRNCLESVYANTLDLRFEIIVVDSASFDGCGEMLAEFYPAVKFIQSHENIGFARANNLGAAQAVADTLLFLNPDTELVGPALSTLYNVLKSQPNAGAVGAKLLNSDGSLQTSCVQSFPTLLNQALDADFLRAYSPRSSLWGTAALCHAQVTPAPVEVLSGACIMIHRQVFDNAGGFPEAYFMYSEDLELCFRVRQSGWLNYYVPSAVITHHGGGSSQQSRSEFSAVMMRESVCRFLLRTRGRIYAAAYRLMVSASAAVRLSLITVALPFKALRGDTSSVLASGRKWFAILKWSLGMQKWVGTYRVS